MTRSPLVERVAPVRWRWDRSAIQACGIGATDLCAPSSCPWYPVDRMDVFALRDSLIHDDQAYIRKEALALRIGVSITARRQMGLG